MMFHPNLPKLPLNPLWLPPQGEQMVVKVGGGEGEEGRAADVKVGGGDGEEVVVKVEVEVRMGGDVKVGGGVGE